MRAALISLLIIAACFFGILFLYKKTQKEPVIKQIDSTAIYKHQFDSIVNQISDFKRIDSVNNYLIDSLIKKKYHAQKIFIDNSDTFHSLLRIQLLARLDSTEFKY
jgi:hypothetical protein